MIYLLTAIGLSPGGSTHSNTNNIQNNTNNNQTTQITTIRRRPELLNIALKWFNSGPTHKSLDITLN